MEWTTSDEFRAQLNAIRQRVLKGIVAPHLYPLCEAAKEHVENVIAPSTKRICGHKPRWFVLGFDLPQRSLWGHTGMLVAIMTVGAEAMGAPPFPLQERYSCMFNHLPGEGARFDAKTFDAGMSLALPATDDGQVDLSPIAVEFDRILIARGWRGTGIHEGPVNAANLPSHRLPRDPWQPWWKLDGARSMAIRRRLSEPSNPQYVPWEPGRKS